MAMRFRLLTIPVALLLLGACDTIDPKTGSADPGFGEAIKYDMAIQTINPDPVYVADGALPGDNGDKGAQAAKRYRTNQVKPLEIMSTSSAVSGSGTGPK
jgi:hypothetical protein